MWKLRSAIWHGETVPEEFSAWSHIFPHLFSGGEEVDNFELESFETTPELVKGC
jgi:hypothetical protein